jgi:peptide chain release factor 1
MKSSTSLPVPVQWNGGTFLVTEVLGHGQPSEANSGSGTWGLVHLAVDESATRSRFADLDHSRGDHLVVQIVAFAGAFAHSGEDRVSTVGLSHVVDQLLDEHRLADTGTSEQT